MKVFQNFFLFIILDQHFHLVRYKVSFPPTNSVLFTSGFLLHFISVINYRGGVLKSIQNGWLDGKSGTAGCICVCVGGGGGGGEGGACGGAQ